MFSLRQSRIAFVAMFIAAVMAAGPLSAICTDDPSQRYYWQRLCFQPTSWCQYEPGDEVWIRFTAGVPVRWYVVPGAYGGHGQPDSCCSIGPYFVSEPQNGSCSLFFVY